MGSMITKPSKNKKEKSGPPVRSGGLLEGAVYLIGLLFLGFLGLSVFAFIQPSARAANTIPYQLSGSYSYTATGTPGVYDTEMVRSGEPVFPRLACFLNIGFAYDIQGDQFQTVAVNQQMFARIMDQPSGWQRTIPLLPQTTVGGNSHSNMATLDLCQLETLVNLVEKETGLRTNTYTVEIITAIAFTANASGEVITGAFDPTLAFKYDKVHLYLADADSGTDPMNITEKGVAGSSAVEPNTLSLFGWKPAVSFIRLSALAGLGISLGALIVLGLVVFRMAHQNEEAFIRLRHGSMLVDVYEKSLEPASITIDVTSMESLVRLAERQGTMILHMTRNFLHYYLVQDDATTYRYVISAGRKGIVESESEIAFEKEKLPEAEPARLTSQKHRMTAARKRINPLRQNQNEALEPASARPQKNIIQQQWVVVEEAPEYGIHTGEIEFVLPRTETEMLKRIRL